MRVVISSACLLFLLSFCIRGVAALNAGEISASSLKALLFLTDFMDEDAQEEAKKLAQFEHGLHQQHEECEDESEEQQQQVIEFAVGTRFSCFEDEASCYAVKRLGKGGFGEVFSVEVTFKAATGRSEKDMQVRMCSYNMIILRYIPARTHRDTVTCMHLTHTQTHTHTHTHRSAYFFLAKTFLDRPFKTQKYTHTHTHKQTQTSPPPPHHPC